MNADAASDGVLLLVCAFIAARNLQTRTAVAVAVGLIGCAAALGVLRFSGVVHVAGLHVPGAHSLASGFAAVVAFPLLACALRWPLAPVAGRSWVLAGFVLLTGGIGLAFTLHGIKLWGMVVPGVAALVIAWTAVQRRSAPGMLGAALLLGSFAVAALGKPDSMWLGVFSRIELLHYLLAPALVLLTWARHGGRAGQAP